MQLSPGWPWVEMPADSMENREADGTSWVDYNRRFSKTTIDYDEDIQACRPVQDDEGPSVSQTSPFTVSIIDPALKRGATKRMSLRD